MQPLTLLLEDELVLGRDCEGLLLADAQVSRRHLRLRPAHGGVEVADLGSTNGTFLNGAPLRAPELVERSARVIIGDTTVALTVSSSAGGHVDGAGLGATTSVRTIDDLRSTSIELVADAVAAAAATEIDPALLTDTTITVVFSDIESSTERATQMGDAAWFALLDEHNRIIRAELKTYGGREVKSIGDGFMLVFPSVSRALRFVTVVQQRVEDPAGPDLRVRMGLHTGEAIADESGDLFGRHINLAARVSNLADGGQIVASNVVKEIAAGREDASFGPPTSVELKGFAEPHVVYEVLWQSSQDQHSSGHGELIGP